MHRIHLLMSGIVIAIAACSTSADQSAVTTSTTPAATTTTDAATIGSGEAGMPWWNDCVFYEIFVRSFTDSNGDGIGDFVGMTERLDYLNDGDPTTTDDLGITALRK